MMSDKDDQFNTGIGQWWMQGEKEKLIKEKKFGRERKINGDKKTYNIPRTYNIN